jgi:hypothetical protein
MLDIQTEFIPNSLISKRERCLLKRRRVGMEMRMGKRMGMRVKRRRRGVKRRRMGKRRKRKSTCRSTYRSGKMIRELFGSLR